MTGSSQNGLHVNLDSPTGRPPLVVDGLSLTYGARTVLNQVGLVVSRGQSVAIMGRSVRAKAASCHASWA